MALATSSMPSLTTETGELLRSRLKAAALFLAVGYGLFFLLGVVEPTSTAGQLRVFAGLRMALCITVAALLASPIELGYRQLRPGIRLLRHHGPRHGAGGVHGGFDPDQTREIEIRLVGLEKNGVINFLILMVLYGVFIPNDPKTTTAMVLTMAMGSLLVLALLSTRRPGRRSWLMN